MDQVTQQNAALVEQAAAAAEAMQEQAASLAQVVGTFQTGTSATPAPAPVAIAAPRRAQARPTALSAARKPQRAAATGGDEWEAF